MQKIAFTALICAVSALLVAGCIPAEPEPPKMPSVADQTNKKLADMQARFDATLKKTRKDFDDALKKALAETLISLCRGRADLELVDVAHNKDFTTGLRDILKQYNTEKPQYGAKNISVTFTDISEKEFNELLVAIGTKATNSVPQLSLAVKSNPPKCVATPGTVDGASTAARVVSIPKVLIKLEVKDLVGNPDVWIMPEKDHWLNKVQNPTAEIRGKLPLKGWSKTKTGGWEATIEGDLPLEVTHDKAAGKFTDREKQPLGTFLYVMAVRDILGGVVEYRRFGVTDPVLSPPDEQIRLKSATAHPACPPEGVEDGSVANSFKAQLQRSLGGCR